MPGIVRDKKKVWIPHTAVRRAIRGSPVYEWDAIRTELTWFETQYKYDLWCALEFETDHITGTQPFDLANSATRYHCDKESRKYMHKLLKKIEQKITMSSEGRVSPLGCDILLSQYGRRVRRYANKIRERICNPRHPGTQ